MRHPGYSSRGRLRQRLFGVVAACFIVAAACEGEPTTQPTGTTEVEQPRYGGRLRAGFFGGGTTETLDPHKWLTLIDLARLGALYDTLTFYGPDGSPAFALAESMEPNSDATEWTVRLRSGVAFHDGKPLTADDVLYTWKRIIDESLQGRLALEVIDLERTAKVDDLTLHVVLKRPHAEFPLLTADVSTSIIPDDFTDFENPNGTGPFRFVSWTRGERSLFARNPEYWQSGRPYVDELEIISIPDGTARGNALLAGDLDIASLLPYTSAEQVDSGDSTFLVRRPGAVAAVLYMRADTPPFDDPRVRQALRLAIDREKCVETGLLGFGEVGNDLFGPAHASYNKDLPQRTYDPATARQLLEQAGKANLRVELVSGKFGQGLFECTQVFRESARQAGIQIDIREVPPGELFNLDTVYLKVGFGGTGWGGTSFQEIVRSALLCEAFFNETAHCNRDFDEQFQEAEGTLDPTERSRLYDELQRDLWESGGYIVWGIREDLDGYSTQVRNALDSPITGWRSQALEGFANIWLSST